MKKMNWNNKKVLVTGGAGVIGKELISMLKEQNAHVRCVDFTERPSELEGIEYYQMDLAKPDNQFMFRFEPEYVFHLAADFERSTESFGFWESNFKNNILASHYLLREIIKSPSLKKVVFASSYLIYDKKLYKHVEKTNFINEHAAIDPRNMTGIAKLQTEMDLNFLSKTNQYPFEYAAARIFRVYGKGSRDVISRWIHSALNGEKLLVFDKDNAFDYIYAGDVAKGLLKLCENSSAQGIFNMGTGETRTISDVISILKKHFKLTVEESNETIEKENSGADITKLEQALAWKPEIELREGIAKLVEFEKNKKNGN